MNRRITLFISYRRDDASANAGRLFDWLTHQFGRDRVFLDTDKIAAGDEFSQVLAKQLEVSDVLLAVIGPQWAFIADQRGRRLNQPDDYVRQEIATALAINKRVIPVLVGGAPLPRPEDLPDVLQKLTLHQTARIDDAQFEDDFNRLVDDILERPRGFLIRELDRLKRMRYLFRASAFVAPFLAALVLLALWMQVLDALTLDTKAASYLLWAADTLSGAELDSRVLIAAIDRSTEMKLGRDFCPTPEWRRDHARLIKRAAKAGATAVVFDAAFTKDTEADENLADAARSAGSTRVIFGATRLAHNNRPVVAAKLDGVADWGMLCINRRLGYTFSAPLAVIRGNEKGDIVAADTPALALAATYDRHVQGIDLSRRQIVLAGSLTEYPRYSKVERIRADADECRSEMKVDSYTAAMLLIRLSRPGYWRQADRWASYADFLDPAVMPDERLRNRIVLVGSALEEERNCPGETTPHKPDVQSVMRGFSRTEIHGVELQADAIANLATKQVITTPTADVQALLMLLLAAVGAVVSFFTATMSRQRWFILGAAVALYGVVAVVLASQGVLLNLLYDVAAFFVAYALLRRLQVTLVRS